MDFSLGQGCQLHAMSVDVEEYFQVGAFEHVISPNQWDSIESRVVASTTRILDIFEKNEVTSTFFILGWVAKRHPELVKKIAELGHEVASHGFYHQRVTDLQEKDFLNDLSSTKKLLEDISGRQVIGYRAPSFSICEQNAWAFDVLKNTGHIYSSSTYPIVHDHYGTPSWPNVPYQLENGLIEIPQSTLMVGQRTVPIGGGGYFRLLPYHLSKYLINKYHTQKDVPYVFYFHPWEIDAEQPRVGNAPLKSKFRHYVNLHRMEKKIASLSADFDWTSIEKAFSIPKA